MYVVIDVIELSSLPDLKGTSAQYSAQYSIFNGDDEPVPDVIAGPDRLQWHSH